MIKWYCLIFLLLSSPVWAQTYGTFANPCSATSLWNILFGTGAAFVNNPNYSSGPEASPTLNYSHGDWINIVQAASGDPTVTLKRRVTPLSVGETN